MGSWGTGPFDSDEALDFLAGLADDVETAGPGELDHAQARVLLQDALVAAEPGEAYAAIGLVAAALTGIAEGPGTRLADAMRAPLGTPANADSLGLEAHCGYVRLLTPDTAHALTPAARAALARLRDDVGWHAIWRHPAALDAQLDRLSQTLPA